MVIALLSFVIFALTTCEVSTTESPTIECGSVGIIELRISRGKKTIRGEWPFLAALFLVNEQEKTFFCGGSLISSKHVLTAAHCIQDKGKAEKLLPSNISVILGAYNLTSKTEIGVQQRHVKEIYVHPEWNIYSELEQYDADLAILLLKDVVLFTDYIRPVCIPTDSSKMEGIQGSVVGWGRTENGTLPNTEFIKRAAVTALNSVYCLTKFPNVAEISSTRTFCGQGADGNANRGDSGGGFYVENEQYAYVQLGIVSSLKTDSSGYVDPDLVVVYTNVAEFKDWIADIVNQSAAAVDEPKTNVKVDLECVYRNYGQKYTCDIYDVDIRNDNVEVASFSGSHRRQKTDRDVEQIMFRNGTLFFIPSGIGQIFKNVKFMEIKQNLNTKRIKRLNFINLENLVKFKIFKNEIMTLDHDSVRDLQQLEVFVIVENRLTKIEEGTFETNIKLKSVYLNDIKLNMLPRHLFRNNLLLELVDLDNTSLKIIDESTFATNINLKKVYLNDNRLEILPWHLFQNNSLLEEVHLRSNRLRIIEVDFTSLKNIEIINLNVNLCINALYERNPTEMYRNQYSNLEEFQRLIGRSCIVFNG